MIPTPTSCGLKTEIVGGTGVGVWLLPERANDRSSCQQLCVERDCGIKTLVELFVSQSDHWVDFCRPASWYVHCKERHGSQ